MQFEHLVAVNDLTSFTASVLTRAQLWQGLLLRAEAPQLFNPHIESVTIVERSSTVILREMDFGNLLIRDRISLTEEVSIHYATEPGQNHAGGQLKISIEEPQEHMLFVRFFYDTPDSPDPEARELSGYLKKMWQEMDVDSIRKIREMADNGQLAGTRH